MTSIFGSKALPQEVANTISKAVKKMIDEEGLDPKNKLDFLRIMAERYLGD